MQETTDLINFRKVDENSFSLNHRDLDTALFSISPNRNMSFLKTQLSDNDLQEMIKWKT